MKDMNMALDNEDFLKAKKRLDKIIAGLSALAKDAQEASLACCAAGDLDERDQFGTVAAHLNAALSEALHARSAAGKIDGGGITRSGGT